MSKKTFPVRHDNGKSGNVTISIGTKDLTASTVFAVRASMDNGAELFYRTFADQDTMLSALSGLELEAILKAKEHLGFVPLSEELSKRGYV